MQFAVENVYFVAVHTLDLTVDEGLDPIRDSNYLRQAPRRGKLGHPNKISTMKALWVVLLCNSG